MNLPVKHLKQVGLKFERLSSRVLLGKNRTNKNLKIPLRIEISGIDGCNRHGEGCVSTRIKCKRLEVDVALCFPIVNPKSAGSFWNSFRVDLNRELNGRACWHDVGRLDLSGISETILFNGGDIKRIRVFGLNA